MNSLLRGLGVSLVALMFLGSNGCAPDNESEALQLQKAADPLQVKENPDFKAGKPAASMGDYMKQQQARAKGTYGGGGNYPGAKPPASSKPAADKKGGK